MMSGKRTMARLPINCAVPISNSFQIKGHFIYTLLRFVFNLAFDNAGVGGEAGTCGQRHVCERDYVERLQGRIGGNGNGVLCLAALLLLHEEGGLAGALAGGDDLLVGGEQQTLKADGMQIGVVVGFAAGDGSKRASNGRLAGDDNMIGAQVVAANGKRFDLWLIAPYAGIRAGEFAKLQRLVLVEEVVKPVDAAEFIDGRAIRLARVQDEGRNDERHLRGSGQREREEASAGAEFANQPGERLIDICNLITVLHIEIAREIVGDEPYLVNRGRALDDDLVDVIASDGDGFRIARRRSRLVSLA